MVLVDIYDKLPYSLTRQIPAKRTWEKPMKPTIYQLEDAPLPVRICPSYDTPARLPTTLSPYHLYGGVFLCSIRNMHARQPLSSKFWVWHCIGEAKSLLVEGSSFSTVIRRRTRRGRRRRQERVVDAYLERRKVLPWPCLLCRRNFLRPGAIKHSNGQTIMW